jgi:hypothetical protein
MKSLKALISEEIRTLSLSRLSKLPRQKPWHFSLRFARSHTTRSRNVKFKIVIPAPTMSAQLTASSGKEIDVIYSTTFQKRYFPMSILTKDVAERF